MHQNSAEASENMQADYTVGNAFTIQGRKTCRLGPTVRAMIKCDISGAWPVLHEFGSSGGDFWFCMTVLIDSRAAVAARPDES